MTITSHADLVDAELSGAVLEYVWRKSPTQATASNYWFDLSMSPGNPGPKYWFDAPPGVAKTISRTDDGGINHGPNVTPSKKYLRLISGVTTSATPLPMEFVLCDYLLYYPSIDESTTDVQSLTNTATLPRYTDGAGVQVIAVIVAAGGAKQSFTFTYTNQDGVAGRTSSGLIYMNLSTALGTLHCGDGVSATDTCSPFLPLQEGDTGVRSIETVTLTSADVGLFSLILVKPLARWNLKEAGCPHERDLYLHANQLPEIKDDAFLSFLCLPKGSLSGVTLTGSAKFIWS